VLGESAVEKQLWELLYASFVKGIFPVLHWKRAKKKWWSMHQITSLEWTIVVIIYSLCCIWYLFYRVPDCFITNLLSIASLMITSACLQSRRDFTVWVPSYIPKLFLQNQPGIGFNDWCYIISALIAQNHFTIHLVLVAYLLLIMFLML